MIMRSSRPRVIALMLLAACSVGTSVKNFAPAKGPAGATVTLRLISNRTLAGELLAVADSSLLVQSGGQLFRVGLPRIVSGTAPKLSFTAAELKDEVRERLRLLSRYPQGVSPELETRLLQAYGQSGVQEPS